MNAPVVSIRLPHLVEDVDRHGNVRLYVRLPGHPKVRLRDAPGSEAFMAAYHAALANIGTGQTKGDGVAIKPGSFGALCQAYYGSPVFRRLDVSTRNWRRRALDLVCVRCGAGPVGSLDAVTVRRLRDQLSDTPGAANARLKAIKALFAWGLEAGAVRHNPTQGVKPISYVTQGHHSWTLDEVEAFERHHPLGTKAHLAMALMLYTAGRREDATRLGPQHVRHGRVRFTQAKNEHQNPVHIDITAHAGLLAAIAATPSGHLTFLVTDYGRPFSVAGFGNRFRAWCDAAGLPHCSAHGLRKAAAARLAERGATTHEIMAVTGHRNLKDVEVYTSAADRRVRADSAMAKMAAGDPVSHIGIEGKSHRRNSSTKSTREV